MTSKAKTYSTRTYFIVLYVMQLSDGKSVYKLFLPRRKTCSKVKTNRNQLSVIDRQ